MRRIIVTDLTKFNNNGLVCLAGVDLITNECIRPFSTKIDPRGSYISFEAVKNLKIIPGTIIQGEFTKKYPEKFPHSEDHLARNVKLVEDCNSDFFQSILERTSTTSISDGFELIPENKSFSIKNPPNKSIITLKLTSPRSQFDLILDEKYGKKSFKVHVRDSAGFPLNYLKVTDLGFLNHIDRISAEDPNLNNLRFFLKRQDVIYLRIGLTQAWSPTAEEEKRHYLQINGIYSFPDFRNDIRIYE